MENLKIEILYQDQDLLVIDKPAEIVVYPERATRKKTLVDFILERFPDLKRVGKSPRYGIIHRLDKDTSGILLVARNNRALGFFQNQFKTAKVEKKYLLLVVGKVKNNRGKIETLIGRSIKDRIKQRVFVPSEPAAKNKRLRKAITEYRVLERFKDYTLLEAIPKTGRKHQIRAHMIYLGYPVAGDKLYRFKGQSRPKGLSRQFLHAHYLKIKLPPSQTKEFQSKLAQDLKKVLKNLKK